jgi:hypothetical protein
MDHELEDLLVRLERMGTRICVLATRDAPQNGAPKDGAPKDGAPKKHADLTTKQQRQKKGREFLAPSAAEIKRRQQQRPASHQSTLMAHDDLSKAARAIIIKKYWYANESLKRGQLHREMESMATKLFTLQNEWDRDRDPKSKEKADVKTIIRYKRHKINAAIKSVRQQGLATENQYIQKFNITLEELREKEKEYDLQVTTKKHNWTDKTHSNKHEKDAAETDDGSMLLATIAECKRQWNHYINELDAFDQLWKKKPRAAEEAEVQEEAKEAEESKEPDDVINDDNTKPMQPDGDKAMKPPRDKFSDWTHEQILEAVRQNHETPEQRIMKKHRDWQKEGRSGIADDAWNEEYVDPNPLMRLIEENRKRVVYEHEREVRRRQRDDDYEQREATRQRIPRQPKSRRDIEEEMRIERQLQVEKNEKAVELKAYKDARRAAYEIEEMQDREKGRPEKTEEEKKKWELNFKAKYYAKKNPTAAAKKEAMDAAEEAGRIAAEKASNNTTKNKKKKK